MTPDAEPQAQSTVVALQAVLGEESVSVDPSELAIASRDALRRGRGASQNLLPPISPLVIVRPRTTADVQEIVRFAARRRLPLVEIGGGTGLMGGARSIHPGIALDLKSMNRVIEIQPEDRSVHVQAGAVLGDVNEALKPHGLMLGHDPWTVPIATVGGTISTNSLGYLGAQYGSMGDQVLGLDVVLGDGSLIHTRPAARSSTGPRLKHLFAGAEGTLGVITAATLRAFPIPERRRLLAFAFPDFDAGFRAIQSLFAIGLVPAMVDFGQTYAGSRADAGPFTPKGSPGKLQLAFEGFNEGVVAAARRALRICQQMAGTRLPAAEAEQFWADRHVVAERLLLRSREEQESWIPDGVLLDFVHVSLPASQVLKYKREAAEELRARATSIVEWGLWNQPELFSVVVQRHIHAEGDALAFSETVEWLARRAQDYGGSMEYCHGAGIRLAGLMEREHGQGMELLRSIKRAADPGDVLNPGKLGL
jgi:FAD/FMN-containing dehydrogenase